jgi:lipopolysaccharide export system permease protein
MTRLSLYLARLFAIDAIALFAVALFLLFLIQCLRIFDVVSVKGQSVLTLLGQAMLSLPSLAIVFFYVCVGIGLGRALRNLQLSHELHIIHSSRRISALIGAIVTYSLLAALIVITLTNFVEPATTKRFNDWSASITADLVGRTLRPHRFAEVVPGVTMVIGGRQGDGHLTDFFADDNRNPDARRTYIASSAVVAADEQGYVLQLEDGAIQYMSSDFAFSQVAFKRYDLALERLTGPSEYRDTLAETNSIDLVASAVASGDWGNAETQLWKRFGEGLRVIAICLFVAALGTFPHGRRGRNLPIELIVLGAAFFERGVSSNLYVPTPYGPLIGTFVLGGLSAVLLLTRLRVFAPVRRSTT